MCTMIIREETDLQVVELYGITEMQFHEMVEELGLISCGNEIKIELSTNKQKGILDLYATMEWLASHCLIEDDKQTLVFRLLKGDYQQTMETLENDTNKSLDVPMVFHECYVDYAENNRLRCRVERFRVSGVSNNEGSFFIEENERYNTYSNTETIMESIDKEEICAFFLLHFFLNKNDILEVELY